MKVFRNAGAARVRALLVSALLVVLAVLPVASMPLVPTAAWADDTVYSEGTLYYTMDDGSITITGCFGRDESVTIPSSIAGYPVNTIATGAFTSNTHVKAVKIPDTITSIQEGAFSSDITVTKVVDGGSAGGNAAQGSSGDGSSVYVDADGDTVTVLQAGGSSSGASSTSTGSSGSFGSITSVSSVDEVEVSSDGTSEASNASADGQGQGQDASATTQGGTMMGVVIVVVCIVVACAIVAAALLVARSRKKQATGEKAVETETDDPAEAKADDE